MVKHLLLAALVVSITLPLSAQYKYKSESAVKLYSLLTNLETLEKFYGYQSCITLVDGYIESVDKEQVSNYLNYLKQTGIFSEGYIKNERKWFDALQNEISKNGKAKVDVRDKYHGSNPAVVKKELIERHNQHVLKGISLHSYFGSVAMGKKGILRTTFRTAGYELKYGISLVNNVWLIDSIKEIQVKD